MNITDLEINRKAKIINMDLIEESFRHRLMDMGISLYSDVELIKIISFGKMYLIEVDDVELCIRRDTAEKIIVE